MKLRTFTHPHVLKNLYDFPAVEHKRRYFKQCLNLFPVQWKSIWSKSTCGSHDLACIIEKLMFKHVLPNN